MVRAGAQTTASRVLRQLASRPHHTRSLMCSQARSHQPIHTNSVQISSIRNSASHAGSQIRHSFSPSRVTRPRCQGDKQTLPVVLANKYLLSFRRCHHRVLAGVGIVTLSLTQFNSLFVFPYEYQHNTGKCTTSSSFPHSPCMGPWSRFPSMSYSTNQPRQRLAATTRLLMFASTSSFHFFYLAITYSY